MYFKRNTPPVYAVLKKDLTSGISCRKIIPGSILPSEYALSRQYGISRCSVRIALRAMEKEGLILKKPGKGSFVTETRTGEKEKEMTFIGVNIPMEKMYIRNPYYPDLLKGIMDTSSERGVRLELIAGQKYFSEENAPHLKGIIWMDPSDEDLKGLLKARKSPLPVVAVNRIMEELNYISTDHRGGAFQGVDYLVHLGHKKIAIAGRPLDCGQEIKERFEGYVDALVKNGLKLDEDLILRIRGSKEEECSKTREFLKKQHPAAMFVTTGTPVANILQAIYEAGLKVPEDISVICFDDMETFISYPGPSLTCIKQPLYKLGTRAVEAALEMIDKGDDFSVKEILPAELIVRQSCRR